MKLSRVIFIGLLFVFFAGFLPAIFLAGCNKDDDGPCLTCPPPAYVPTVQLNIEDVAVTEVWLKLKFTDTTQPRSFTLLRNGQLIQTGRLAAQETLLVDYTAQANQSYAYKVLRLNGTVVFDSSDAVPVTTLDATSHFFSSVAIDTLGENNGSEVDDVAIVNDTLAYAVGTMTVGDTTYSVAIWNGKKWVLQRLFFNTNSVLAPIRGIWIVSLTDIWLAAGSIFHWNGSGQQAQLVFSRLSLSDPNATIEKLWATSSQNIYGVGNAGTIVSYNGSVWQKLSSGTTLDIQDIWGVQDPQSGQTKILCTATNTSTNLGSKILLINPDNTVDSLSDIPAYRRHSVWFETSKRLMVSGDGVFTRNLSMQWQQHQSLPSIYTRHIRGTKMNDVFVVGDFGLVAHYNGLSWQVYPEVAAAAIYISAAYRNGLMFAVGSTGAKGIVVRMKR